MTGTVSKTAMGTVSKRRVPEVIATMLFVGAIWSTPCEAAPVVVDRAVARFTASEIGGARAPHFVYERALAFEARLQALEDPDFRGTEDAPYRRSHVQNALERLVAETLLESLPISPEPARVDMERRTTDVRLSVLQRVGGVQGLQAAQRAEGIANSEVIRILRRRARASLYLDRMVAPMLEPSHAELQSVHRSGRTPFSRQPFDEVERPLRRWYVSEALKQALVAFYDDVRARVRLEILTDGAS